MSMDTPTRRELQSLLSRWGTGDFDAASRARLVAIISQSEEARQEYLDHCQIHAMLRQSIGLLGPIMRPDDDGQPQAKAHRAAAPPSPPAPISDHGVHRWSWLALVAVGIFVVGFGLILFKSKEAVKSVAESKPLEAPVTNRRSNQTQHGAVVAKIIEGAGAAMDEFDALPMVLPDGGLPVRIGSYHLTSGVIGLLYESGARLVVSAPADFELISVTQFRLLSGQLSAHMPTEESKGFTVETPSATAIDFGTEFAVEVAKGPGSTDEFHVFSGEVLLQPRAPSKEWPINMTSGQAVRLDHETNTPAGIRLDDKRFIRRFEPSASEYSRTVREFNPAVYLKMEINQGGFLLRDSINPELAATIYSRDSSYVPWAAGLGEGSSFRLDGNVSRTYAAMPEYPRTQNNRITVAAWVLANSRPLWASIAKNWGEGSQEGQRGQFHFGLKGTTGQLEAHINDIDGIEKFAIETEPLPLGTWQHVAMVANDSRLRLYRNGKEVGSVAYTKIVGSERIRALSIGAKLDGSGSWVEPCNRGFWDGTIDELAIFNHALTREEIKRLYDAGRSMLERR